MNIETQLQVQPQNQLQVIVKESGLTTTKAQYVLEKFESYFKLAADWEAKAKAIVVTDESQIAEMQMARMGRLFLREKRIDIEKARKALKEEVIREGKAIDGISNVLKALIEPIENYLDQQEHFAEIKAKERAEKERLASEAKAAEELALRQKQEQEEREKIKIENERLKKEAQEREALATIERKKNEEKIRLAKEEAAKKQQAHEKLIAKERAKAKEAQDKVEAEKRAIQEKAKKEKEAAELKSKKEREAFQAKEKAKTEAAKAEKERLQKILANQIECPHCHTKFQRSQNA